MGMFYNKLMESAVDDAIQTPDDIGVDLDAIEKNIAGNDGIEAHREEIDDALSGVVDDPLEEAAIIMYESEYNFNQLLKCIGMAELNEMAAGRDFVMEAGGNNSESFWEKTKQVFVKMFENITRAFNSVIGKLTTAVRGDKAFANKNSNAIRAGFNKEWEVKGYDLEALNYSYEPNESKLLNGAQNALANPESWTKGSDSNLSNATMIKNVAKVDANDAGEAVNKLKASMFVEKTYNNNDSGVLNTVMNIMNSTGDIDAIRESYKKIKNSYNQLFKDLKAIKGSIGSRNDKDKDVAAYNTAANTICIAYINAYKYEKNLQNTLFTLAMKAHRTRRNQARAMCAMWCRKGDKDYYRGDPKAPKKKENKVEVQQNSALFSVDII